MAAHTVTGPLRLADPAPLEVALRTRAHHVHAATCAHQTCVAVWFELSQCKTVDLQCVGLRKDK
jgi:hypothetical protein